MKPMVKDDIPESAANQAAADDIQGTEKKRKGKDRKKKKGNEVKQKGGKAKERKARETEAWKKAAAALAAEIAALRSLHKEIIQQYSLRVEGQMVELIGMFEKDDILRVRRGKPTTKNLLAAVRKAKNMKLKPKKGRLKDIAAVYKWVAALAAMVPYEI